MKLKNVGTKIVSIGARVLMPDDEISITNEQANTPAIQALAKHGFLSLTEDAPERKSPDEHGDSPASELDQTEPATPKRGGRGGKKSSAKTNADTTTDAETPAEE